MQTWLGWGTLNIKEFLDTARMSNSDRESGSASSNYTPHPWGGKYLPPHFPFWVPASLWNVLWGTVWCPKGQDTSNDLWVGGSCLLWIHLLISTTDAQDEQWTRHTGATFSKHQDFPKFWTPSFLQAHRDTPEESGVVPGQFCTGVLSQLTVKQGHLLTHPLPFHPKRKKNILDNSGLNPGINSHTDYKSHRGKIHKIVSKSKNRSRLRVSTLVTEHDGISILKGKWNKKNIFFELILNERQIQGNHMPILDKWKRKRTLRKTLQSLRVSCPKGKPRGTWSCDCAASLTPGSRGCVGIPHGFGQTK